MCGGYWSIKKARLKCPKCNKVSLWEDLQTHYGDYGYMKVYELGKVAEPIKEIDKAKITSKDGFIGVCKICKEWCYFGAVIKRGAIVKFINKDKK